MEGSAVMLPQYAPYTDPVEIFICGGSTPVEGDGLDNCVTIAPEAPNATWTLERSVSTYRVKSRVVSDEPRECTAVQARHALLCSSPS
jgi:hypothetical protein